MKLPNLFGKPPPAITEKEKAHDNAQLKKQKEESEKTLSYVKEVLETKDQLLARAINETGAAVRRRPRPRSARGAHH